VEGRGWTGAGDGSAADVTELAGKNISDLDEDVDGRCFLCRAGSLCTEPHKHRQIDRQTDRQTESQTDRETDRQMKSHVACSQSVTDSPNVYLLC